MGNATGHDLYLDLPLSNVACKFTPSGNIADDLAPIVQVPKQGGSYYIWDLAETFRIPGSSLRGPGDEALTISMTVNSATFWCNHYAYTDFVPHEDIVNADAPQIFTARSVRAENIVTKLGLEKEQRIALTVNSTSNVGSYSTVTSAWTDHTNSNPLSDIDTAIQNIYLSTGQSPNRIVFGYKAWNHFKRNANVKTELFGNNAFTTKEGRIPTETSAAGLFDGIESIKVGKAVYNSAGENQTAVMASLWDDDNVLIYYAPMQPRINVPSYLYDLRWNKVPGLNMTANVYDIPRRHAEAVEVGYYSTMKIVSKPLSFLITSVESAQ